MKWMNQMNNTYYLVSHGPELNLGSDTPQLYMTTQLQRFLLVWING